MAKQTLMTQFIKLALSNVGCNMAQFDKLMGWSNSCTSAYMRGRRPGDERIKQIEESLGLSFKKYIQDPDLYNGLYAGTQDFVDITTFETVKLNNGQLFGNRPDKTYLVLEGVKVQAQTPTQAIENIKDITIPTIQIVIENGQIVLETPIE